MPITKKAYVLIVDDEPDLITLIEQKLSGCDVTIVASNDGSDASLKINRQLFNVIFLDFNLPRANGLEVLAKIRKEKSPNKDTPVIIVSAYLEEDILKKLLPLKISGILTKPIDDTRFFEVVNKYLKVK